MLFFPVNAARIQIWDQKKKEKALWRALSLCLSENDKSGGPSSSLHSFSSYICMKVIKSKQNVHFIQYGCFFFFPKKRANSLRKSDSCDLCYSLSLKQCSFSDSKGHLISNTWVTSLKKHNLCVMKCYLKIVVGKSFVIWGRMSRKHLSQLFVGFIGEKKHTFLLI